MLVTSTTLLALGQGLSSPCWGVLFFVVHRFKFFWRFSRFSDRRPFYMHDALGLGLGKELGVKVRVRVRVRVRERVRGKG